MGVSGGPVLKATSNEDRDTQPVVRGGLGRRREGKGPQWSFKGGSAPRYPRLSALVLQRIGEVLRIVQEGAKKMVKVASRLIHPGKIYECVTISKLMY